MSDIYTMAARKNRLAPWRRLGRHAKNGKFYWWSTPMGLALRKKGLLRGTIHTDEIDDLQKFVAGKKLQRKLTAIETTPHVRGKEKNVHPRLLGAIEKFGKKAKRVADVVSGLRSYRDQNRLYQGFINGLPGFNPANPPGQSKHEGTDGYKVARAVDLYIQGVAFWSFCDAHGLRGVAEKLGLRQPHKHEPWHVELAGL